MLRLPGSGSRLRAELGVGVILALWVTACSGTDDAGTQGGGATTSQAGGSSSSSAGQASGGSQNPPVQSDFPDAQIYVDAHNAVRALVMKPPSYSGTWAPLPAVTWSNDVAQTAQAWADHLRDSMSCGLEHASGSGYGENLAAGTNVGAQKAVDMWAAEGKNYSYSPEYVFMNNTGHYTQIVWRTSIRIGCASAKCSDSSVVVCRYDPPGNYIGDQIY